MSARLSPPAYPSASERAFAAAAARLVVAALAEPDWWELVLYAGLLTCAVAALIYQLATHS